MHLSSAKIVIIFEKLYSQTCISVLNTTICDHSLNNKAIICSTILSVELPCRGCTSLLSHHNQVCRYARTIFSSAPTSTRSTFMFTNLKRYTCDRLLRKSLASSAFSLRFNWRFRPVAADVRYWCRSQRQSLAGKLRGGRNDCGQCNTALSRSGTVRRVSVDSGTLDA